MLDFLCEVCDREILDNESVPKKCIATSHKENDKSSYTKYTFNYVKLDEFDKILNDYISHHIKKFDLYFFKLIIGLKLNNDFTQSIETNYCSNIDIINMKSFLLYYIDCFTLRGFEFCNISHITINIFSPIDAI